MTQPKTTPMAAGEAEVGWRIWYGGKVRTIVGKKLGPRVPGETDRKCQLWLDGEPWSNNGDEGQTIYRIVEEDE